MKIVISFVVLFFLTVSLTFSQWSEQTSGVTANLKSVSCVDQSNVWVCGYLGTILRTTNGGLNWQNKTGNGVPTNVSLINVCGITQDIAIVSGYISGSDTWVWRTTNGGDNWTQVFTQATGFINAVVMLEGSTNNGFMMGDPVASRWSLWKTTNGGANWDSTGVYLPQNGTEAGWNNSMFAAGTKIWFGTNSSRIYYSSNSGLNWTAQISGAELNTYAIWFWSLFSGEEGIAGGTGLVQTTNSGMNWSAMNSTGTGSALITGITSTLLPVSNPQFGLIWLVRAATSVYMSSNNGVNWITEYTAPAGNYNHISVALPGRGIWAVRTNGGISYHSQIQSVKQVQMEIPADYSLMQNYPNPFNAMTKIRFSVPVSADIKLKIYDVNGREILTLVDSKLSPGEYESLFDAGNLSSGVYFYRLESNNYTETKKMMLVK